jgi:quercetin dioxygenase-like cupin family protein
MEAVSIVRRGKYGVLDVFGSTVDFLTLPGEADTDYCVMIGTIPPGGSVPLHSHPHPESFFLLSGSLEVLTQRGDKFEWQTVKPGEFVYVPSSAKHAWRSSSSEPAVTLVTTTPKLGRFFQEIGRAASPGAPLVAPTPEDLQHLMRLAAKYEYWIGSPAENAAFGISSF